MTAPHQLTPANVLAALAPLIDRCRTSDHWIVPAGGSPIHQRSAPSQQTLLQHARRLHGVGLCPIQRGENITRLALLDLDSHKGDVAWPQMMEHARRLAETAAALFGIRFVPFRSSGGRGIHLYALWPMAEPQDARSVRTALAEVLDARGFRNGTKGVRAGQIEIFPKQDAVPADGWGSMFVLPMTGASEPLCPYTYADIALVDVQWPDSASVPVVAPEPVEYVGAGAGAGDLDADDLIRLATALDALDPDAFDYDGWLQILFAVHDATQGSDEGAALIDNWSQRWSHAAPGSRAETAKQWRAARSRPGGITAGTLYARARMVGWSDPTQPQLDVFGAPPEALLAAHDEPVHQRSLAEALAEAAGGGRPGQSALRGTIAQIDRALRVGAAEHLAYDAFTDDVVIREHGEWRPFTDEDLTMVRIELERRGFASVPKLEARDAIWRIARENGVDSARSWLMALPPWDGVDRVTGAMARYWGCDDTDYTQAVGRYLFTALAGRVVDPGCQADMVPVLVGGQGLRKSRTIMALAPLPHTYVEIDLNKRDADQSRLLRGKIVGEIAELRGLYTRDVEAIKAWITRETEEWVPKFREATTRYPRRCVFIGTGNRYDFLGDATGNRRWLPVDAGLADPDALVADREQLYAQGLAMYTLSGIDYADAERLARQHHWKYSGREADPWAAPIARFISEHRGEWITSAEILLVALRLEVKAQDKRAEGRLAEILRGFGCAHRRRRLNNRERVWGWDIPVALLDPDNPEGLL